jgi:branched-chain amino acid transport system permease protein
MSVYMEGIVILMGINILMSFSVYAILSTDQLSLGNAGFMAIGAYTSAYLTVKMGWPLIPALIAGAVTAGFFGLLVGIPALRLEGLYLVMATFGFGEVVRTFFMNFEPTGGAYGFRGPMGTSLPLVCGFVLLFGFIFWRLSHSRLGSSLDAVRDDPGVAQAVGLNVNRLRLGTFVFGASIAGIAGGLYAHYMFYIESSNFNLMISSMAILFVILGGMYTFWGALLGAVIFSILPEMLRFMADWRMTIYAAILVAVIIVRPHGLITRSFVKRTGEFLAGVFGPILGILKKLTYKHA